MKRFLAWWLSALLKSEVRVAVRDGSTQAPLMNLDLSDRPNSQIHLTATLGKPEPADQVVAGD